MRIPGQREHKTIHHTGKVMNTLGYYNKNARNYTEQTRMVDLSELYVDFEECLNPGARILDLGCGSGRDSKYFLEKGYAVIPVDGSAEMCIAASEYLHIPVRQMLFSELKFKNEFDGIWACASLLHVPKTQIRDIMAKVERALKPDGVLYASFKYGEEEKNIDGRHFSFYNETDLDWISDLGLIEYWISEDVRLNKQGEKWLNTLWRKI